MSSGVPQESVIGLVLFVVYINDLFDELGGAAKAYEDDTKLLAAIRPGDEGRVDVQAMQHKLDAEVKWSRTWLIELNVQKCKVMHIGSKNPRSIYTMEDHSLETTNSDRDLGVIITPSMKWSNQAAAAATKANKMLSLLKRTFKSRDVSLWTRLYKTYIRPHLDYAAAVWSPRLKKDVDIIEKVQRRVTKTPHAMRGLSYEMRCSKMNLNTLEKRRLRGDLIQLFKITTGREQITWTKPFEYAEPR